MMNNKEETGLDRIQACAFAVSEIICLAMAAGIAASCLAGHSSAIAGGEIVLDEKINPNYAPMESIARLPNIGFTRAEAIIAFRENFKEKNKRRPFQDCNDLQDVIGIGPKTAQNINKWLRFE